MFLALEHGSAFAAQATAGSLVATAAQAAFCVVYCRLTTRGWPTALAGAGATFSLVAGFLQWSAQPQRGLLLVAILAVTLALTLVPKEAVRTGRLDTPRWDLPTRMTLIAGLVVCVMLIAPYVGPKASGVIASFPFMAIILAVFSHRTIGHTAAQHGDRTPGVCHFFLCAELGVDAVGLVCCLQLRDSLRARDTSYLPIPDAPAGRPFSRVSPSVSM